ncbi:MAG: radical SAM domain heme biosynthesis protein [candidate division CPR2 bacterium GW2011_GWC1_39_9]|uniref:Molybdenum cofactor biosynthesis enzyme n=1 Tax=candidate division CPR2 bacterium GW2011_GWC2_39_10 TaxID=1618345 RepID=A0A0G0LR35_UNCC2|nr:MAG: Molybdenum cofactor biosynthesis enzyme [candidate division CPR2 bacterium GW2011_GWC2_39_10]KKR33314.1 MAG: radical SAM domain heme biosynthesis protein [candidate division CPR2 bacterium GW2011_GWC1_39_9]
MTTTPVSLQVAWLNVNHVCNFRCPWCYAAGTNYVPDDDMSIETAKRISSILYEAGVRSFTIIGGEPSLWPHLMEFNDVCRELGVETGLVTNGSRFGSDKFWKAYLRSPCDNVGLSIKVGTIEQFKSIAGKVSFNTTKKGLARAIAYHNAGVSTVYSTFVENSLLDVARFARQCGSTDLKLEFCSAVFNNGKASSSYMVGHQMLADNIIRDYPELMDIMGGKVTIDMSTPFCLWPEDFLQELVDEGRITSVCNVYKRTGVIIDGEGRIMVCNGLFDYPIGQVDQDFDDAATLIAFLNSHEVTDYYQQLTRMPSPFCAECKWYSACGGGCPLNWAVNRPEDIVRPRK